MPDRFLIHLPPEYDDWKKRLNNIMDPYVQQKAQLEDIVNSVSLSLPEVYDFGDGYSKLSKMISGMMKPASDLAREIENQIQHSKTVWEDSRKKIVESVRPLLEKIEQTEQILLSEDSPLKVWGKYGWTISPQAKIVNYCVIPKSKDEADTFMNEIHNDKAIKKTIQLLKECEFHHTEDIVEVESLFNEGHYKACALMLFTLIDSLLIHTQDKTEHEENRLQGNKAIKIYEVLAKPDEYIKFTTRMLSFIVSVEALKAFFDQTQNFMNDNPVLNRHLACHGMLQRDVNKTDCKQLMLLYGNMLHSVGKI